MEYEQQIRVKVTQGQLDEIKRAAMRLGLPLSVYARFAIMEKVMRREGEVGE